jgi:hypothetical protein
MQNLSQMHASPGTDPVLRTPSDDSWQATIPEMKDARRQKLHALHTINLHIFFVVSGIFPTQILCTSICCVVLASSQISDGVEGAGRCSGGLFLFQIKHGVPRELALAAENAAAR